MSKLQNLREKMPPAAKDIQLNLGAVLDSGTLEESKRWGVALATAFSVGNRELTEAIVEGASQSACAENIEGLIDDARASAALMAMNNVYYRFKHMIGKEAYATMPARLRMNRIMQLRTDRTTFELMCLAVSAVNGCESCVRSHERSVLEGGLSEAHVNDAIRIASTVRAAATALALT